MKSHNGKGVAKSIKDGLDAYEVKAVQLEGGSFDGQYEHLSIHEHLSQLYGFENPGTFICSTDPLHRCGTVDTHIRKDESFDWLTNAQNICKDIYSKFNWGKNYELLVETCEQLDVAMKSLTRFHDVRFANSVRFVFINIRADFPAIIACLETISMDNEMGDAEAREKANDARRILHSVANKKFCLRLSGIADVYDTFGVLVNVCQKVDVLPYERYDEFHNVLSVMDKMALTLDDHLLCAQYKKCLWPRYHEDLKSLSDSNQYVNVDITRRGDQRAYQTRLTVNEELVDLIRDPCQLVKENIQSLINRMKEDLRKEVFDDNIKAIIEDTRVITDLKTVSVNVFKDGPVLLGAKTAQMFLDISRNLASLSDIPDDEIKDNYKKFLKVLYNHISEIKREKRELHSRCLIKDFLSSTLKLYDGIELTVHIICVASVKLSVESVVESLVSRYETHFRKGRQLSEEHSMEEMTIAENGPILVRADSVLKHAMDTYWKIVFEDGKWHFTRTSARINTYLSSHGMTISKLLKEKSKFPFQDK